MKFVGQQRKRGFTLIEMIVSVGLFAVVMVICVASLLALVYANRKAQGLQSVMNNLNIALDDMARNIRMGNTYYCGAAPPSVSATKDCAAGINTQFEFEHFGGNPNTLSDNWVYSYNSATKQIYKSTTGGAQNVAITSPEVSIDDMRFYVVGTTRDGVDTTQPRVIIIVKGTAAAGSIKTKTTFHIQATAVQRLIDL